MIPRRLNETNPQIMHYKRRVWKHSFLDNRYFSPTIGYFTVEKVWFHAEFDPYWSAPVTGSHWRCFTTVKAVSDAGTAYILRQNFLDAEGAFRQTYN